MINFNYESDFKLHDEKQFSDWLSKVIKSENYTEGEINYIFCNDEYLHKMNVEFLNHDELTDIISFDYSEKNVLSGDIFISVERVIDNAKIYDVPFEEELKRVAVHGILHYCGYKDKTPKEASLMRKKEEEKIKLFHVEHN